MMPNNAKYTHTVFQNEIIGIMDSVLNKLTHRKNTKL